ncbi:MAG TPA: hypothetical protein VFW24_01330 [Acidimicrobiales bacterium]|nr:hypothetical protein [Acidimicrobiales bacterium]
MQLDDHPIFTTPAPVPEELAQAASERGWPDGLLERALAARANSGDFAFWLGEGRPPVDVVLRDLETMERLLHGPVRAREATWRDGDALVDLYADSPEDVGDLEVTVERGPNPWAQFRLQEHANLQVLNCKGILLAAAAHSSRNAVVGGERLCVHLMSAWRVRREFRGFRLSRLLQMAAGPGASTWFGVVTYWYERSGNAAQGWLDKIRGEADSAHEHKVEGLSATVHRIPAAPPGTSEEGPGLRIRPVEPADVPACVELINATHAGLDLFRPYSTEYLEQRLDDPFWGPRPSFWNHVYGWEDHRVVERDGRIVACGGLWDRGRDLRERWRHKLTGEEQVMSTTALLDWGHAPGYEGAMAALIRHFAVRTGELGRVHLLAPLEFAPEVLALVADPGVVDDTRALRCMGFEEPGQRIVPRVSRPYTDVAYW